MIGNRVHKPADDAHLDAFEISAQGLAAADNGDVQTSRIQSANHGCARRLDKLHVHAIKLEQLLLDGYGTRQLGRGRSGKSEAKRFRAPNGCAIVSEDDRREGKEPVRLGHEREIIIR